MNATAWFAKSEGNLRRVALVLFCISMLGTWGFDLLNVPAQYRCSFPTVRLYGDYCGYPISGLAALFLMAQGFFGAAWAWLTGMNTIRPGEILLGPYFLLVVLSFFSALRLTWAKGTRRQQVVNILLWGLACVPLLLSLGLEGNPDRAWHSWGLWLYLLAAVISIVNEVQSLRAERGSVSDRHFG